MFKNENKPFKLINLNNDKCIKILSKNIKNKNIKKKNNKNNKNNKIIIKIKLN
jgi:hypothetical protein